MDSSPEHSMKNLFRHLKFNNRDEVSTRIKASSL